MEPLVAGIFQCPQCKKIIKQKEKEKESKFKEGVEDGDFHDGEYFHKNASLNKQYEICEKGIIINKTENRLFAVLICHNPYLKDEKYVRLSWWKNYQLCIYHRTALERSWGFHEGNIILIKYLYFPIWEFCDPIYLRSIQFIVYLSHFN